MSRCFKINRIQYFLRKKIKKSSVFGQYPIWFWDTKFGKISADSLAGGNEYETESGAHYALMQLFKVPSQRRKK